MNIKLRPGKPEDTEVCGTICYESFKGVAEDHGFKSDFSGPDVTVGLLSFVLSHPAVYPVVAEAGGEIVGSNFLWEIGSISGVGPITIKQGKQSAGTGRKLMEAVLARVKEKGFAGVRLVQAGYNMRSLSLYTKLGFEIREPLANIQGPALNMSLPDYKVRKATVEDVGACNQVCNKIHGHEREAEVQNALEEGNAMVVEHAGRITGYTCGVGFFSHTVAETNAELKALIGAAPQFIGSGFLLPMRNTEVFQWCLENGLRVVQPLNLMSKGLYNEPKGAFLPSILF